MFGRAAILRINHIAAINGWLKARPRRLAHSPTADLPQPGRDRRVAPAARLPRGRRCALLNRIEPLSKPSHSRAISPAERKAVIRPGAAAATFGAMVGLAVGCAYLGGAAAKATTVRAQAERIESATAAGFTEEALAAAAGGLDESALAIARRHDPYTVAGSAQRDRQAELLTARLEQTSQTLGRASGSLETVLARMERGEGTLGKLSQDEALYGNLNSAAANLNQLVADIRANPKKYLSVSVF